MNNLEAAVFGGGCFWCTEAVFIRLKGVESVESGYAGGQTENPTYEQVSSGDTGHAEAIKIQFDPNVIQYADLLNVFFATHDPTTLNRQGNDVGTQYRSAVFYTTLEQKQAALQFIKQLQDDGIYDDPIMTEVTPLSKFWPAESYHRRYYDQNQNKPYCQFVINPKIAKLRAKFASLLKPEAI
jgi:peptide-methionine (S)-S-oxide reductase